MKNIQKELKQGGWIDKNEEVTVKHYENMIKILSSSNKQNPLNNYVKTSKNTYFNKDLGEEKQYKQNENKTRESIQLGIVRAKDILINNFFGHQNVLFITLTFEKANMDFKQVQDCFRNFYRKMTRRFGNLKYFYVIELQKQRQEPSLHIHSAIKHMDKKRFCIEDKEIAKLWGKGFTKTERLYNIEGITAYFTKDLLNAENLKIYSKYGHIYYCSLNLDKVEIEKYTMAEFIEKFGNDFYRDEAIMINIIDSETGKIMCNHKKQIYKRRKYKRKSKRRYKYVIPVRFLKLEGDTLLCDDIYSTKLKARRFKSYGIKIPINTQNTLLINKLKKLKKSKQWLLLEFSFPIKLESNTKVLDVIDKADIVETHLF